MNHAAFIAASYGATAIVLASLILWVWLDGRVLRRRLADLDARGIRRRSNDQVPVPPPRQRSLKLIYLLPLGFFLSLALIFLLRLESGDDLEAIPSALVGQPAPAFDLPALAGVPGLTRASLDGKVTVLNIFASWCAPCRAEHPLLMALAKDPRIQVVGINYKDQEVNARRFLDELGNPYAAVAVDARGRTAIDWGVYGVPETFVVGPDGIIRHKTIGPLTPETVRDALMPAIEKALTPAR